MCDTQGPVRLQFEHQWRSKTITQQNVQNLSILLFVARIIFETLPEYSNTKYGKTSIRITKWLRGWIRVARSGRSMFLWPELLCPLSLEATSALLWKERRKPLIATKCRRRPHSAAIGSANNLFWFFCFFLLKIVDLQQPGSDDKNDGNEHDGALYRSKSIEGKNVTLCTFRFSAVVSGIFIASGE